MTPSSSSGAAAANRRTAIKTALFVLAYAAATVLGIKLRLAIGSTALWIAGGVMVAGLMLLERRVRPAFVLFATLAALMIGPFLTGRISPFFITYLAFNTVESLVIAWAATRLCGPRLDFSRWRHLALLAAVTAPVCLVTSTLGAALMHRMGMKEARESLWFQSHALATILLVPAITILARPRRYRSFTFNNLELFGVMSVFALFATGVFLADYTLPLLFLLFPAMIFLAFRYGPVGASLGVMTVGALALYFTFAESRVLTEGTGIGLLPRVQLMQAFMAVIFFTALPVSGAVATSARMRLLLARRTLVAREARQKAERATSARGEFLANMSHEIRTPLNGVLGLADALWRTELKADQRDMLKMILTSGKALTGLLSDALDLARADSGAMEIVQEPFVVRELIAEAAFPFEHLANAKGLRFETEFEGEIPYAGTGDPLRIRQILSNLVSNAIKFTNAGTVRLLVACEPDAGGRLLRIAVQDTGIGMDSDMRSRLFRRFEQGDSSVTRRYGGCGLGLSIAHKLAELMGGRLVCESAPGRGSTFTLRLPLPEADPAALEAAAQEQAALDGRLRVLLAEDHPVNQKVVQIMLGDQVELTVVADGQAAVEAVKAHPYDVVLMDTHMPVMDGLTAMRAIREWELQHQRARLPIISLTADAMPQQVAAAAAAGADLHLSKPITSDSLVAAIHESQALDRDPPALARVG